jgi:hypothetical protein
VCWLRAAKSVWKYRRALSYVKSLLQHNLARNKLVEECNGNEQKLVDLGNLLLGGRISDSCAAIQRQGQLLDTCSHCGVSAQSSAFLNGTIRDGYRHSCFGKSILFNKCLM